MAVPKKKPKAAWTDEDRRAAKEQRRAVKEQKRAANRKAMDDARRALKVTINDIDFDPTLDYAKYQFTPEQVQTFYNLVVKRVPVDKMSNQFGLPHNMYLWNAIGIEGHPIAEAYARGKQKAVAHLEEHIEHLGRHTQLHNLKTVRQRSDSTGYSATEVEVRQIDRSNIAIDVAKWTLGHYKPDKHGKNAQPAASDKNEQLDSLFKALMSGPAEEEPE